MPCAGSQSDTLLLLLEKCGQVERHKYLPGESPPGGELGTSPLRLGRLFHSFRELRDR